LSRRSTNETRTTTSKRNFMSKTAFFTDERTFWHTGGTHALFFPVGGWVQPPNRPNPSADY
jgi:hypothetical protein